MNSPRHDNRSAARSESALESADYKIVPVQVPFRMLIKQIVCIAVQLTINEVLFNPMTVPGIGPETNRYGISWLA